MSINSLELSKVLQNQFLQDGDDLIGAMSLDVENLSDDVQGCVSSLMRGAHNLKGSAQLSGYSEFGKYLHDFESVLQMISVKKVPPSEAQTLTLFFKRCVGSISKFFTSLSGSCEFDAKDQSNWETTLTSMRSLIASFEEQAPSVPEKSDFDGPWQTSTTEAIAGASSGQEPPPRTVASKIVIDPDKGWGLFEDTVESVTAESITAESGKIQSTPIQAPVMAPSVVIPSNQGFKEVNKAIALRGKDEQKNRREEYLLCINQGSRFAIPVSMIQEILPNRADKPLPVKRAGISGVISFRGQIMAILSLFDSDTLSLSEVHSQNRCVVVCQLGSKQFGFRVDHVSSVIEVSDKLLQPLPGVTEELSIVRSLAQIEGHTVSFIDPGLVLAA